MSLRQGNYLRIIDNVRSCGMEGASQSTNVLGPGENARANPTLLTGDPGSILSMTRDNYGTLITFVDKHNLKTGDWIYLENVVTTGNMGSTQKNKMYAPTAHYV